VRQKTQPRPLSNLNTSVCPAGKSDRLVKVLRPTEHKLSHFGDVLQANLLARYGQTKPNATKAQIHQSKEMYHNTKQGNRR